MPQLLLKQIAACVLLLHFCLSSPAYAVVEVFTFSDPALEKRYRHFTTVLRCPKCQNQNLEGSDSPIAADLRRELYVQLEAGKTDEEIISFMITRYGDFVLYNPPLQKNTRILWYLPALMLCAGIGIIFWRVGVAKKDAVNDSGAALLSEEEWQRLSLLTGDNKKRDDG